MSEENKQEHKEADQDLTLAAIVHNNVTASKEAIGLLEKSLEGGEDVYSVPRDILTAIKELLETNVKMVTEMFEENQQFHEQAEKWQKLRDQGRNRGSDVGE